MSGSRPTAAVAGPTKATRRSWLSLLAIVILPSCSASAPEDVEVPNAPDEREAFFVDASVEPPDGSVAGGFGWDLPPGFPLPVVPRDNPMSTQKVELGRHLFYDKRLSINERLSCASCHKQNLAFTDGRRTALGATGEDHPRSSMSLANVAYAAALTWADPSMTQLEEQALVPLLGTHPVELGFASLGELEQRLQAIAAYQALFAQAFPSEDAPIHAGNVGRALASFQRTLISGRSPFDRWLFERDEQAMGEAAKRGFALFVADELKCSRCHAGFALTENVSWAGGASVPRFRNTGLYNIDGAGAYPEPNTGVHAITGEAQDMGLFKVPSLRNIAVTAPYMHDGSIATLSEVLDHYAAAGRTVQGAHAGVGSANPFKDSLVAGFELSKAERADLIAFLESLTDSQFLTNPKFGNPW